ncbi:hypothetical protein WJX73_000740 [Symbiochloris irregularis]|uniref:DNA 3'-5' helicase n=1 Tax=Symbiochloris irregularis TaxID=706552 RepID=A0AAW1PQZ7_9CHLO
MSASGKPWQQAELLQHLQQHFGIPAFRANQESAIRGALAGRDVFVSMPTGGGKSLCYSLPAVINSGLVLVISPLIALMQNQVEALRGKGIHCDFMSSSKSSAERQDIMSDLQSGQPSLALLFATPELIATASFQAVLKDMHGKGLLKLFAIDEAHCISSWGHDFRPAYRKLSTLRRTLPGVPIMALTATAADKVREDIIASLALKSPVVLLSSFDRENISYSVRLLLASSDVLDELTEVVAANMDERQRPRCAIIYALKRTTVEHVAHRLSREGIPCKAYHAGMPAALRAQTLQQWTSGAVPVVSATIAFGMGIDKPDVRMVVHLNLPKTLEGFYQESGRAGRDGQPSQSIVFYSRDDRNRMDYILGKESGKKRKRSESSGNAAAQGIGPQQAFGKVVQYCTSRACKRALVLAHFGEQLNPGTRAAQTCCDYCRNPVDVDSQLKQLEAESVPQRLNNKRRGHWDHEHQDTESSCDSQGSGLIEEGDEQQAAAEVVALNARRQGNADVGVVEALAQAEKKHSKSAEGHSKLGARVLALNAGKPMTKPEGRAAISQDLRAKATEQLSTILQSTSALQCFKRSQLVAAAQGLEQQCYDGANSKAVYRSVLANTCRAAPIAGPRPGQAGSLPAAPRRGARHPHTPSGSAAALERTSEQEEAAELLGSPRAFSNALSDLDSDDESDLRDHFAQPEAELDYEDAPSARAADLPVDTAVSAVPHSEAVSNGPFTKDSSQSESPEELQRHLNVPHSSDPSPMSKPPFQPGRASRMQRLARESAPAAPQAHRRRSIDLQPAATEDINGLLDQAVRELVSERAKPALLGSRSLSDSNLSKRSSQEGHASGDGSGDHRASLLVDVEADELRDRLSDVDRTNSDASAAEMGNFSGSGDQGAFTTRFGVEAAGSSSGPGSTSSMKRGRDSEESAPLALRLDALGGNGVDTLYQSDVGTAEVTVGRLDGNALTIPDSEVSGHHITLRWDGATRAWHVVDMGSLNGTMLNDRIISTSNRRPGRALRLSSDDIIQLGTRTKLKVTCTPHEMKEPMLPSLTSRRLSTHTRHRPLHSSTTLRSEAAQRLTLRAEVPPDECLAIPSLGLSVATVVRPGHGRRHKACEDAVDAAIKSEDGCTATTLLTWQDQHGRSCFQVANVGDSSAVLVPLGQDGAPSAPARYLTADHRLTNGAERDRLQGLGITLGHGGTRLYGLNLGRCLGDRYLKVEDLGLSAQPHVSPVECVGDASSALVIIASDGVWDVASPDRVVQAAMEASNAGDGDVEAMARAVAVHASKQHTKDDLLLFWIAAEVRMLKAI